MAQFGAAVVIIVIMWVICEHIYPRRVKELTSMKRQNLDAVGIIETNERPSVFAKAIAVLAMCGCLFVMLGGGL